MHEIIEPYEMRELLDKKEGLSNEYRDLRKKATQAKLQFDYILTAKIREYMDIKKNIGYETARLLLLSEGDSEVIGYDRDAHLLEADYKGLEKVIDAVTEKILYEKKLSFIE